MTKEEYFEKNGFSSDGVTYCVVGEDTYSIKEYIKEIGGKYNPILKWHLPAEIDLGEDFCLVKINFNDIMHWDDENEATYYPDAENKVSRALKLALPPSKSEYMGEVGERLRNLTAVYKSVRGYNSKYGWVNIYSFYVADNCLVWFSRKDLEIKTGTVVNLTGTIAQHEEFRGVKTTKLSRCIVKEIAE